MIIEGSPSLPSQSARQAALDWLPRYGLTLLSRPVPCRTPSRLAWRSASTGRNLPDSVPQATTRILRYSKTRQRYIMLSLAHSAPVIRDLCSACHPNGTGQQIIGAD